MANVKITQLPLATTPLTGTEVFPLVQGTTTKQVAITGLFTSPVMTNPTLGTVGQADLINATGLPISTGVAGLGTGIATFLGTPSSSNLRAAVTDETGTGSLVFATSPTLVTPNLGTPTAMVATNITGTALGLIAGSAITNANLTGAVTSVGNATSLGSFTSAQLATALTDETGSGANVFATSPTLVTPDLGTPSAGVLTNATGLPLTTGVTGTLGLGNGGTGQTTANAAFNALAPSQTGNSGKYLTTDGSNTSWATNPLGTVTSVAATVPSFLSVTGSPITTSGTLAFSLSGTALPTTSGGTGLTSFTSGGVVYASSTSALATGSALTYDGTTLKNALTSSGVTPSGNARGLFLDSSANGGLTIATGTTSLGNIFFADTGDNADGYLQYDQSGQTMRFGAAAVERMRLTSTGLGIGTTSPAVKLDVAGSATLGSATTDVTNVSGYMSVGGAGGSTRGISVVSTALTGTTQYGLTSQITSTSSATGSTVGFYAGVSTAASAYTASAVRGFWVDDAGKGAGSTITNQHGVYISDQTKGTNNYGITSLVSSGTNKYNIYASGTADNYFAGNVGIGTTGPITALQVNSASSFVGGFKSTTTNGYIAFQDSGTSGTLTDGNVAVGAISNDMSFRSGGAARMRLDSAGNLGLGVTPSAWISTNKAIDVNTYGGIASSTAGQMRITQNSYLPASGVWTYKNTAAASYYEQNAGQHAWYNAASGTAGTTFTATQAMTLNTSGNLGLGLTNPDTYASRTNLYVAGSLGGALILGEPAKTFQAVVLGDYNNGQMDVGTITNHLMRFITNNTERARIPAAGGIQSVNSISVGNATPTTSGAGITFPATQSASSDANTLDDYEEGTWTPVISGSTSAGVGVYSSQVGKYTKIGNTVFISADLAWSAHTGTGNINVTGLPFTSASGSANPIFVLTDGLTITGVPTVTVNSSASTMYVAALNNGATSLVAIDTSVPAFRFTGFYYV